MRRVPYVPKRGDPTTASKIEPPSGTVITMTTAQNGNRTAYRLSDGAGWTATFGSRVDALAYADSNAWHLKASALESRDATVNQFSGSSPGEVE